jgi:hypothetical protein
MLLGVLGACWMGERYIGPNITHNYAEEDSKLSRIHLTAPQRAMTDVALYSCYVDTKAEALRIPRERSDTPSLPPEASNPHDELRRRSASG